MAVSESLYGPWKRVGLNGKILEPPTNPLYWNYKPSNGVNNPAFLQHPDGGYFLYFKSQGGKMGLAIAEMPQGPYIQLPFPVTKNNQAVEDGTLTQEQADFMGSRWGSRGSGPGFGHCSGYGAQSGFERGSSGRWNNP